MLFDAEANTTSPALHLAFIRDELQLPGISSSPGRSFSRYSKISKRDIGLRLLSMDEFHFGHFSPAFIIIFFRRRLRYSRFWLQPELATRSYHAAFQKLMTSR